MKSESREQFLQSALKAELDGALALREVLEREAQALTSLRADELEVVVGEKHNLIVALEEASARRDEAIMALGYQGHAMGVVTYMETAKPAPALRDLWQRLEAEVGACAELNRQNEYLNQGGQRRLQQLLRLLRGESAEPLTYEQLGRGPVATP